MKILQNLAKLCAILAGLIAMRGYITAIAIYVRLVPVQAPEVDSDSEGVTLRAAFAVLPIIIIFLLVFGGIYGGYFTPTEGAAVGAAATFIAALFKRELTWSKFLRCF